MKIALNLLAVQQDRPIGVERFTRNVVGSMRFPGFEEVLVVATQDVDVEAALGPAFATENCMTVLRTGIARSRLARFLYETVLLSFRLWRCDVVLSVNNFGPWFGKWTQRRIVVVHDVWFLSDGYEGGAAARWVFSLLIRLQVLRTHHLVTVSERSGQDIRKALRVPETQLSVVPNCVRPDESWTSPKAPAYDSAQKYFLAMGSDRANKNMDRTIAAFSKFRETAGMDTALICVGKYRDEYVHSIQKEYPGLYGSALEIRGFVDDSELYQLMAGALGIVFLSLYEGFGIPVVEALAKGKPVLVSRGTVCEEIAGDAGIVVDGRDIAAIVGGLKRLAQTVEDDFRGLAARRIDEYLGCDQAASKLVEVVVSG